MEISEKQFRKTLGLFSTGVTVVTTLTEEGKDIGITISSLTSLSLDPPQVLFCLSKNSKTMPIFKVAQYFVVNILNENQAHLSDGFARHIPLDWEKVDHHRHPETGCLLLKGARGYIICEKGIVYEGGDHEIILGRVIDLIEEPPALPLIRQKGQYLTTQPIEGETTVLL